MKPGLNRHVCWLDFTGSQRFLGSFMIKTFFNALSADDERKLWASLGFPLFKTAKFIVRKQVFQRTLQRLKFLEFEKC